MYKLPSGPSAYCDIDSTLIEWDVPKNATSSDIVTVNCRGIEHDFYVNKHNLEFIIKLAARGHVVICWSAGGSDWCEAVIKALGVEKYIWAVMSKPTYYIDDIKDSNEWIGKYRFYDFDGNKQYKYGSIVEKDNEEN